MQLLVRNTHSIGNIIMSLLNMKPSVFKNITEAMADVGNKIAIIDRNNTFDRDIREYQKLKNQKYALKERLKNECDIVFVSFSIGSRSYNQEAYKVGKFYYTVCGLTKLTKYYNPIEIPAITQEMRDEAMADSYYY